MLLSDEATLLLWLAMSDEDESVNVDEELVMEWLWLALEGCGSCWLPPQEAINKAKEHIA